MTLTQAKPPIVAILAGGLGTRLRSLIADKPKSLAMIAGEPFLFLILRTLKQYGISDVILLTGYLQEQIQAACGDGRAFGLTIHYSNETTPLGTGGAIAHAKSYLEHHPEFILMNGDTFLNSNLNEFIHQPLRSIGLIGVLNNPDYQRFGSVQFDDVTNTITAFREKDAKSTGIINAGIYKFSREIFNFIPERVASSLEKDIFPAIISSENEKGLKAYLLTGELRDIGTPESYTEFNDERMKNEPT